MFFSSALSFSLNSSKMCVKFMQKTNTFQKKKNYCTSGSKNMINEIFKLKKSQKCLFFKLKLLHAFLKHYFNISKSFTFEDVEESFFYFYLLFWVRVLKTIHREHSVKLVWSFRKLQKYVGDRFIYLESVESMIMGNTEEI